MRNRSIDENVTLHGVRSRLKPLSIVAIGLVLLGVTGCATSWQSSVVGYVDASGELHDVQGDVRITGSDSLEITTLVPSGRPMFRLENPQTEARIRVHRDSVLAFVTDSPRARAATPAFALAGIGLLVGVLGVYAALAPWMALGNLGK